MANLVIVALPSEDDYVNKISSEQVAHMTLLFLGDVSKVKNFDRITSFVEHATEQMLTRFGLGVDRRGALGQDSADVVFFKTRGQCFNDINNFRSALLQDIDIRTVYDSIVQHDEWLPHLTLGYPDSPANPDDRDYPGIYWVNFDRIAVWYKEFDGDEFLLESDDEYVMMSVGESTVSEILEHHGVLGMRWGHRSGRLSGISAGKRGPSSSRSEKRAAKKLAKQDKKLKKDFMNPRKNLHLKIEMHNAVNEKANKEIQRINAKPQYKKAFDSGMFANGKHLDHPLYKKYENEQMNAYVKLLNDHASTLSSPSKNITYSVRRNDNDFLGFTVTLHDKTVTHSDVISTNLEDSFRILFVKNSNGEIIGFKFDNSMAQSAIGEITVGEILKHISEKPWSDYTEADYTLEQWHKACLIHQHDGPPTSKSQCKLPVRTPSGALNRNGVHAALAALHGARSPLKASTEEKAKATTALRGYYKELGEDIPDSLKTDSMAQSAIDYVLAHHGTDKI